MMCLHLLEDLPIGPLVCLAVDLNRLVPRPHLLDELLVGRLVRVQLDELVALPVGSDIEGGKGLVATHHEGPADDAVVGLPVDGARPEEVLSGGFEAGEETTCAALLARDD